jgi:hypothetical protein
MRHPCPRCGQPLGDHRFKSVKNYCKSMPSDPKKVKAAQHAILSKMMPETKRPGPPRTTIH